MGTEEDTNTRKAAMVEIPEEIVSEILLKVPVKSLLKFKRVCKLWYSIISDPQFAKKHLEGVYATHYNQHMKFLGICISSSLSSTRCVLYQETSNGSLLAKQFDFPYPSPADESNGGIAIFLCNYCDGLICFDMRKDGILIWNPSLPTAFKIIKPAESIVPFQGIRRLPIVAMGHDPVTNDYKIVTIPHMLTYHESLHSEFSIEVFSFKSNLWRKKKLSESCAYYAEYFIIFNGIYTRNRMHWLARGLPVDKLPRILCFDFEKESLSYVNLPSQSCFKLLVYKDSLATVDNEGLWVLQNYNGMKSSWNKVLRVEGMVGEDFSYNFCFKSNGDIVVETSTGFCTYDTKDGRLKETVIEGDTIAHVETEGCTYMSTYVESLVSPS